MWNGKMKALTFSYDDGVNTDRRLAEIFDKYGLKCTFNLNGSNVRTKERQKAPWKVKDATISLLPLEEMEEVYKNHEIALHSYTHPHLEEMSREMIRYEILADICRLEEVFGKRPVGMAYPFGTYNDTVVDVLRECGVKYSRTICRTYDFKQQDDLLRFNPTCHHKYEGIFDLIDKFVNAEPTEPMLFYIWGHSYEFEADGNWELIEKICEKLAGHDDIYYCTNAEALL